MSLWLQKGDGWTNDRMEHKQGLVTDMKGASVLPQGKGKEQAWPTGLCKWDWTQQAPGLAIFHSSYISPVIPQPLSTYHHPC